MQKVKSIIWILWVGLFLILGCINEDSKLDHNNEIAKYKNLLLKEPNNCFYLGQIAKSYQALYDFEAAIDYYQKIIEICPSNSSDIFQLGICHYLIMDKEKGINYMDQAIKQSREAGDADLTKMFVDEKEAWLKKWDFVKKQKWNN